MSVKVTKQSTIMEDDIYFSCKYYDKLTFLGMNSKACWNMDMIIIFLTTS